MSRARPPVYLARAGLTLAGLALMGLLLAGCVTGERGRLGAPADVGGAARTTTGNVAVDRVLAELEGAAAPIFTATYGVTRKLGPNSTTGVVVHDGPATSITVGDVRFLHVDEEQTCSMTALRCEDGILEARISDYSVGSEFYAEAPARALRVAYERRGGEPVASQETIAGQPATCVQVPVGPGTETYCAAAAGLVARWDTTAVNVELQAFQDTADPTAFVVPGS